MVQHIPSGVKQPADPDEVIGSEPSICEVGDDRRKCEFPYPEAAIEIRSACARNHDCIEVLPIWFSEERARTYIQHRNQHRRYRVHEHLSSSGPLAFGW